MKEKSTKIHVDHYFEGMLVATDYTRKKNLIGIVIGCEERWCLSINRTAMLVVFFAENKFYEEWMHNLNMLR